MISLVDDELDPTLRAPDTLEPLLDNDGQPITELDPDSADALARARANVAELASRKRTWRYGHVIVDEAQDLTPMQWRMVQRRARGNSMTIVGDLAQRSIGPPGTWRGHLPDDIASFDHWELSINYRSPSEINAVAAEVLGELAPELSSPRAIRSSGHPVEVAELADLGGSLQQLVREWRDRHRQGRVAVIGAEGIERGEIDGVQWLSPWTAKGLEFDAVVIVEPARILEQQQGLSLLYVALTRSTDHLLIAHRAPLPTVLERAVASAR